MFTTGRGGEVFSAFADDCMDGVDAFLFVVKWGRFKPEHERALDAFASNAGEDALVRCLCSRTLMGMTSMLS